ncbi:Uncharacterised protein [uncultured archaeon]|nr:Uncharacterised protein [uncultured archaeon]
MDKLTRNYFLNALMAAAFAATAITGLVQFFGLASGKGNIIQSVFGLRYLDVIFIHNYAGLLLILLIVVHIILHLDWILLMTKKMLPKKAEPESQGKN